jgi:cytochrome P450
MTAGSDMADERGRIFIDPAAYTDPERWHAVAAELRAEGPVHRVEGLGRAPFWAILGHPEVMEVERSSDVFTNAPAPVVMADPPSPDAPATESPVNTLIQMDGEEHRAHRALVNEWFKPGQVKQLSDQVALQAERSVDEMAAKGGSCDFAVDVAMNYPLRVILDILGLPEEQFPKMLRLTQELFADADPDFQRVGEDEQALSVIMDVIAMFTGLNAERRANPTADLATVIANGEIDGRPLEDMDTYGYYLIVATAGHDTTSNAVAGGMQALLEHPEQLAKLQADPSLVDSAADEIVRWVSPVKHFMRTAQEDHTLASGATIPKGDWVLLSYQSANRDERVFADPFTFDVTRPDADKHLGFGFGRHYCLGAHLARLEIRAIFKELLSRLDTIELAGPTEQTASVLVNGPKRMPVSYAFRG